jgi:hypothetical protein
VFGLEHRDGSSYRVTFPDFAEPKNWNALRNTAAILHANELRFIFGYRNAMVKGRGGIMRSLTLALGIAALLVSASLLAQQPPSAGTVSRDVQALNLLDHALSVAGGASAIAAITDYTATGSGTWYQASDHTLEGTVTISGTASEQLRFDAHLPTGVRSYAVSHGHSAWKTEDERLIQTPAPHTAVPSSDAFAYKAPMFAGGFAWPLIQIAAVLNDSLLEVSYRRSVQIDGRPAHEIQVRRLLPGRSDPNDQEQLGDWDTGYLKMPLAESSSMYFFIDAATHQVVMTQDVLPKHVIHQLRYSDYRPVKSVLVPFSIAEFVRGQQIWAIHVDQISFNTGLQDSSFELQ